MNRRALIALVIGTLLPVSASAQVAPRRGVSDAEKVEASAEHLARMKATFKQVLGRVEEARDEKDVVKLNCVNEKLAQIKALLRVAEQADVALHEAIVTKDPGAETEFSKVAIARTKVDALRGEADQCIGQLAYVVDEKTTVEVVLPDDLPDADQGRRRERRRGSEVAVPPVVRPPAASLWYP